MDKRVQHQNGRTRASTDRRNCINPAITEGYIVVSVCATIVDPDEHLGDTSYWALCIRQEEPDIYLKPHEKYDFIPFVEPDQSETADHFNHLLFQVHGKNQTGWNGIILRHLFCRNSRNVALSN